MAITKQDFSVFQRSDYALEYTITKGDGSPQDCTGASFELIWTDSRNGVAALNISDNNRFVVSGINSNVVTITITEEELDVSDAVYRHELRLRDVFGNTAPVATGTVTVNVSSTNVF